MIDTLRFNIPTIIIVMPSKIIYIYSTITKPESSYIILYQYQ